MAIHIVTHRKGGSTTEVTAAVSRLKAAVLRSGAEDFRLSLELAGPEAGQWILVIRFSDMASFGRAMGAALADPDSRAILEDLEKVSPMTSRRIVAEVDYSPRRLMTELRSKVPSGTLFNIALAEGQL